MSDDDIEVVRSRYGHYLWETIARCRNDDPETTEWAKEDALSELKRICARTKRKHRYRNGLHVRQCTEHHGCEFLIRVHQDDDIEWVVQACGAQFSLYSLLHVCIVFLHVCIVTCQASGRRRSERRGLAPYLHAHAQRTRAYARVSHAHKRTHAHARTRAGARTSAHAQRHDGVHNHNSRS